MGVELSYPLTILRLFLKRWAPALFIMAVIFAASSQTKVELPDFGERDVWVKKLGHVCGYAALAWAYLRGLTYGGRAPTWRAALLAVVAAALYGASDEYHQSFVAGRGASAVDVAIDTVGAMLGVGATAIWRWWREQPLRQQNKPAGS
jgi:VanZ family protein